MSFVQVEMILQALEYEMGRLSDELICSASMAFLIQNYYVFAEHGKVLDEFFLSTAGRICYFIWNCVQLELFDYLVLLW